MANFVNCRQKCEQIFGWLLTFGLWVSLILCYSSLKDNDTVLTKKMAIVSGVVGFLYIVFEFVSSTFSYLGHLTTVGDIYSYMQKMFYTPVDILMSVECYHFRTEYYTEKDKDGKTVEKTREVRVTTHCASEHVFYRSWRDISGSFILDTSEAMQKEEKTYMKLHLSLDVQYASDGTEQDYINQRESFKARNRRDTYQDYSECKNMNDYNEFMLVQVTDYLPSYFGVWWFVLSIFLSFAELYKLYINKFCGEQEFSLVKLISSRSDLNSPQTFAPYAQRIPTIFHRGNSKVYDGQTVQPAFCHEQPIPPEANRSLLREQETMNIAHEKPA